MKQPQLFINMKDEDIPWDEKDSRYISFWDNELNKVKNGITIDGYRISGWLYWHLSHWKLTTDDTSDPNNINSDILTITPQLRDNELIINDALIKAETERRGLVIMGLRQMGKELANYEPLITDNGVIKIGDAKIGDKIFDENGNVCNITGVYPQGLKPIYRMHLIDGRFIDCGLEHLWEVHHAGKYKSIKSTKDLLNSTLSYKHKRSGYSYTYHLPNTEPVKFSKKELPIHPYVLGALLGDGGTSQGTNTINCTDLEIIENFRLLLPEYDINECKLHNYDKPCRYTIVYKGEKKYPHNANPLNQELIKLGLKCKSPLKFIPEIYKYSSIEDRYELIRGLFDTDGSINEKGGIEIKLSSKQLIDDIEWVLRSLGIQCRQNVYDVRGKVQKFPNGKTFITDSLYYRLFIKTDKPIFKLKRKADRIVKRKRKNTTAITKIEYLCDYEATCIQVDSPNSLFLTKDFIVTHNTSFMASYAGRSGTVFENSQNLIMGTNKEDLNNITQNIDFGLLSCSPHFRVPRISRDWDSERVLLGYKIKAGDNRVYSTYVIRNTGAGKKTEKGAGVSNLKCNLWDEIGKEDFLSALVATKPAMLSANGWRTIPICTGTGGNVIKAQDAKKLFFDPLTHNFLEFQQEDGRKTGLFMPGWLRQDCKYFTNLGAHLLETGQLSSIPDDSELWNIQIAVSNREEATQKIKEELENLLRSGDMVEYNRWKAYYPLTVNDIFLTESNNKFPIDAIKQHQTWLKEKYEPIYADLYRDLNGKVQWKHSELRPLNKFPIRPSDNKEACVQIFELPVPDAPKFTYCIGIDPVNANESNDKIVSLYSIYVYKRMISPLDLFKDQVVCSISYRPKELSEAHELSVMIAEFYNAVGGVLPEASENSLFQYFFLKRKGHFLADSFDLITEINAKTKIGSGKKGLPVNAKYQRHYMGLLVEYANEEIIDVDEEGDEILKLGVAREYDYMLLEEYKEYKGKTVGNGVHDGNYDRVIARGCAQTLAEYYNAKYPITSKLPERKQQTTSNLTSIRTMFGAFEKKTLSPFSKESSSASKLPSWMRK